MNIRKQKLFRREFCALLRGERQGKLPDEPAFWVAMQGDGVFFCVQKQLSAEQRACIPTEVLKGMDVRMLKASALRMRHALANILRALNNAGIAVICMRGQALAETLYQPAEHRVFTDFDLLFDAKDSLMLKQVLGNQLGYRPLAKFPDLFKQGDLAIDLHTEPLGIERMESWADLTPLRAADFFQYAEQGTLAGEPALLVHARVMLPYLCFHALKHSFDRLIWLYDIALLSNQVSTQGQWDEVLQGIKEYGLQRPCYYALSHAKVNLGATIPNELLEAIRPDMGFVEQRLFQRHMNHEVIPYLAERLFARMLPSWKHRLNFWRETIYPKEEVRAQIAGGGCVKCSFIRKRLKQLFKAFFAFIREGWLLLRA